MNKIYVEVPITTNQTTLSIPCGDDESLWHFTVIFNENEYLHKRLVPLWTTLMMERILRFKVC